MSINWVMLTRDGRIVAMPNEKILHTSRQRVSLDITTPRELQLTEPFSLKCDSGIAYITNERVIYLPALPTDTFRSFFAPILNFSDTHVQSSWLGPWSWVGVVKPVPAGGIPFHVPRVEIKLSFKDGGHHDFQTTFELLKERLHHARELGLVPSENIEPPPPYDPGAGPAAAATSALVPTPEDGDNSGTAPAPAPESGDVSAGQHQPPLPGPDEPPPDYDEAQAQAVATGLDEVLRNEVESQ